MDGSLVCGSAGGDSTGMAGGAGAAGAAAAGAKVMAGIEGYVCKGRSGAS
jgi:hypothetical protein